MLRGEDQNKLETFLGSEAISQDFKGFFLCEMSRKSPHKDRSTAVCVLVDDPGGSIMSTCTQIYGFSQISFLLLSPPVFPLPTTYPGSDHVGSWQQNGFPDIPQPGTISQPRGDFETLPSHIGYSWNILPESSGSTTTPLMLSSTDQPSSYVFITTSMEGFANF